MTHTADDYAAATTATHEDGRRALRAGTVSPQWAIQFSETELKPWYSDTEMADDPGWTPDPPAPRTAREHMDAAWEAAHVPEDGLIHAGEACVERYSDGVVTGPFTFRIEVSVTGGGRERRLIDPRPSRPGGAEEIERLLAEAWETFIGKHHSDVETYERDLADFLASRGLRVERQS